MRAATILLPLALLLIHASQAAPYGYSRIFIERTWDVESAAPYEFTGALAVNDTNQRVLSVTTVPAMEVYVDENGTIMLHRLGNGSELLKASALIDVDYDHAVGSDPGVPMAALNSTALTAADGNISVTARELSSPGSAALNSTTMAKSLPVFFLIAWIISVTMRHRFSRLSPPYSSSRLFHAFDRKVLSRWVQPALSSTPSKPAFLALSQASPNLVMMSLTSGIVSS